MRLLGLLGVLCIFAAPAMGASVVYEFTTTGGTLTIDTSPDGVGTPDPVIVPLGGTFAATIDASDGHIGESDTITLGDGALANTESVNLVLLGLATCKILPGSAAFMGFMQPTPAHIGMGGAGELQTDAMFDATLFISGLLVTTFTTNTNAGALLPFSFTVTTSGAASDIVEVALHGVFQYEIGVTAISNTLTLDLIIDVVGTAHVVPDPAFGGLTALGLAGAGAWLRRRS